MPLSPNIGDRRRIEILERDVAFLRSRAEERRRGGNFRECYPAAVCRFPGGSVPGMGNAAAFPITVLDLNSNGVIGLIGSRADNSVAQNDLFATESKWNCWNLVGGLTPPIGTLLTVFGNRQDGFFCWWAGGGVCIADSDIPATSSGPVRLQRFTGGTASDYLDGGTTGSAVTFTAWNTSAAPVSSGKTLQWKTDTQTPSFLIDVEDCG